jgi:hypothetical protein
MSTLILDIYVFSNNFLLFELDTCIVDKLFGFMTLEAHETNSLVHICLLAENSLCGVEVNCAWRFLFLKYVIQ